MEMLLTLNKAILDNFSKSFTGREVSHNPSPIMLIFKLSVESWHDLKLKDIHIFVVCETRINILDIHQCSAVIHCLCYIINCFIIVSLLNCFVFITIIATQLDHADRE